MPINKEYWDSLDEGTQDLYKWQYGIAGGFKALLFEVIKTADYKNRALLHKAYPKQVDAFINFAEVPDWWPAVLKNLGEERE